MIPSSVDGELVLKFEQADNGVGALICLMAKHVDDLKLTRHRVGPPANPRSFR